MTGANPSQAELREALLDRAEVNDVSECLRGKGVG